MRNDRLDSMVFNLVIYDYEICGTTIPQSGKDIENSSKIHPEPPLHNLKSEL